MKVRICKGLCCTLQCSPSGAIMSNIYRYVPIQISNVSGDISLFTLVGALNTDSGILIKNYIWDTIDIDQSQINILVNNKEITFPLLSAYQ